MNEQELKQAFERLPEIEGEIEDHSWKHRRQSIRRHVRKDDLKDMLEWSTMTAVMFVAEAPYIEQELSYLLTIDRSKWMKAIHEPGFGEPHRLSYYINTSGNLVHQAYHLKQWEDHTKRNIDTVESIFEFGGGYGAMALVARQLAFKGRYILHDFPEMLLLQQYYLSNVKVKAEFMEEIEEAEVDLYIACFSLSESPLEVRANALNKVHADSYLFVFQSNFEGVNNLDYFNDFAKFRNDLSWHLVEVDNGIPHYYYLIGA